LFESKSADLYHFMGYEKTESVFVNDYMPAKWKHKVRDEKGNVIILTGNSFTRNKHASFTNVRLTIDQELLSSNYKIIPIDGQRAFGGPNVPSQRNQKQYAVSLDEEFVIGDIKNLHRYIKLIEFRSKKEHGPYDRFSNQFPVELYEICEKYAKKFNISFSSDVDKSKLKSADVPFNDNRRPPQVKIRQKPKLHRNNPAHPLNKSDKYK